MVKGSNLLEDLLNKEVSRGELLKVAGFAGALATLAACSGDNYPKESASPSADIQRETADARPTPTPTTPEAVEQKPLPRPEQIISREKMDELFTLPNWDNTLAKVKENGGGEEDAAMIVADHTIEAINAILNPLTELITDEEKSKELGLGQHIQDDKLNRFCEQVRDYVRRRFSSSAIIDPTQGSIPQFFEWIAPRSKNNSIVSMTECNRPGLLTSGDQFSRTLTPHNNSDQQRVFKYTHYPGSNPIIRIEGTWDMGDNLSPNAGPAVCQKVYRDLREGYEDVSFQFDFAPPAEGGPMMLADVVVKKHS